MRRVCEVAVERLRIAFCVTELDPGGAERALVELVTRLDRRLFEPVVYSLSGHGELVERLRDQQIPTTLLLARHRGDIGVLWRLRRELVRFSPQILQTWLFHANIAGRIAGRLAGITQIVSGIRVAERRSRWPLLLDRWTTRLVRSNVCVSQEVARFSIDIGGLPSDRVLVIPNGVELNRFRNVVPADLAAFGIRSGEPVLVCVGRLDRQKGLNYLLEAIPHVQSHGQTAKWLLVGDGNEGPTLRQIVTERGLDQHVFFAGWQRDIPAILAASTGLVLPSLWEGMPNVVLEAMAAGKPVIASAVEGVSELVTPGATGWIVPPRDPIALSQAMRELLSQPERAHQFGQTAQDIVSRNWTWERVVTQYQELYLRLASNSRTIP